jgi:hypothetical protein
VFVGGTTQNTATSPVYASNTAKAWVNFNGGNGNTVGVINASYNVSSVTATGTGTYAVTMTNAMVDANYVIFNNHQYSNSGSTTSTDDVYGGWLVNNNPTTTQFWVASRSSSSNVTNVFKYHCVVFR